MKKRFLQCCSILIIILVFFNDVNGQSTSIVDNIAITKNGSDVNNLMKLGDADITKTGFLLPSQEKLYKKAEDDLRKKASALGANVIYIKRNEFTQQPVFTVHVVAEFYKNPTGGNIQTTINTTSKSQENLVININSGIDFKITGCTGDAAAQTVTIYFTFSNNRKADQSIELFGNNIYAGGTSVAFDNEGNQFPFKNVMLANDNTDNQIKKELPTGLVLKGSITFSNILTKVNTIAIAKMSTATKNWDDGRDGSSGMIIFKNVKVNWNGSSPDISPDPNSDVNEQVWNTSIKNLNNGIDFFVTECKGDATAQTATIFFTFANPRKSNQKIALYGENIYAGGTSMAFDNDGSQFPFKSLMLAGDNNGRSIEKELPYDLILKGSITFSNVLPSVKGFAVAKMSVLTCNWDGGANRIAGMIEIKNIKINWGKVSVVNKTNPIKQNVDYLTYNDLLSKLNNGENATNKKVILDNVYFETNQDVITENSKTTLQSILRLLIKYPKVKITILGHTDNVGRDDDNQSLSFSRARAVVTYLVSKGINRDRLFYKGFGSSVPIDDNSTVDGRAKNRRTEMEIMEQ